MLSSLREKYGATVHGDNMDFKMAQNWRNIIITGSLMVAVSSAVIRSINCGEEEISCRDVNETCILGSQECDGEINCPDASDEDISRCQVERPMLELAFLCSNHNARTTYTVDLCHPLCLRSRYPELCFYAMMTMYEQPVGTCKFPKFPENGNYEVVEPVSYAELSLFFSCNKGFDLLGDQHMICKDGEWKHEIPTCKKLSGWEVADEDLRK